MEVADINNWLDADLKRVKDWLLSGARLSKTGGVLLNRVHAENRTRELLKSGAFLGRVMAGAKPIT